MSHEPTPERKLAADEPAVIVARGLLVGRERQQIRPDLCALDWSADAAKRFIDRVEQIMARFRSSEEARRQILREANNDIVLGVVSLLASAFLSGALLLITAIGILVIALSLAMFVPGA